jgi:molybdopterin molybdotransferase
LTLIPDPTVALGRVLAESVRSPLDFPHWDNSAMDGYAVRQADLAGATPAQPVVLRIRATIPAGQVPQRAIAPGECARIFTGSMLPAGADTVVMQEHTTRLDGERVAIAQDSPVGEFVRRRGDYAQVGSEILAVGTRIGAPEVAVLAAVQCAQVRVYRPPAIAILSTGDELVGLDQPGQPLQPGQIVDSNQYALAAAAQRLGATVQRLGIVRDDPAALRAAMLRAIAHADVVLSTGGVSVGDYDFVETLLEELGATIAIRAVAIRPGKPLTVATLPRPAGAEGDRPVFYFGLPGNPASALVTTWRFVAPLVAQLAGITDDPGPRFSMAIARSPLRGAGRRETYLWGRLVNQGRDFELAAGGHSSANLINLARTNALAIVPQGITDIPAGQAIQVMQIPT